MPLIIRRMEEKDIFMVLRLEIKENQTGYVSPIEKMLGNLEADEECHLLEYDTEIIGFFLTDQNYWQKYDFSGQGEIGFLGFFIDASHQGRGLGKVAVKGLKPYLKSSYPEADGVVLTVNIKNKAAIKVYLAGGFEDTGEEYLGGRAGPQHIMRMGL